MSKALRVKLKKKKMALWMNNVNLFEMNRFIYFFKGFRQITLSQLTYNIITDNNIQECEAERRRSVDIRGRRRPSRTIGLCQDIVSKSRLSTKCVLANILYPTIIYNKI